MNRCYAFSFFLLSTTFFHSYAMDLSDDDTRDDLLTGGRVTFDIPPEALIYVTDLYNKFPKIPYQKIGSHDDDTYITSIDTINNNANNTIVSADNKGYIKIWRYPSNNPCLLTIQAHDCGILGVKIRPQNLSALNNQMYIMSYAEDMSVKIWAMDGACYAKFTFQGYTIVNACWLSHDLIAIATDNAITIWNITSLEQVAKKRYSSPISCLAVLDHETLAYATTDETTTPDKDNATLSVFVTDHALHTIAQAQYSSETFGMCTTILSCDTDTIIIGCARGWLQINYHNRANISACGHEYKGICDPCTIQRYDNECVSITRSCGLITSYNYKTRAIIDKRVLCKKDSLFTGLNALSILPEYIVLSMYDQNLYISDKHKIKQL